METLPTGWSRANEEATVTDIFDRLLEKRWIRMDTNVFQTTSALAKTSRSVLAHLPSIYIYINIYAKETLYCGEKYKQNVNEHKFPNRKLSKS